MKYSSEVGPCDSWLFSEIKKALVDYKKVLNTLKIEKIALS